jgi:hypothetical protein
MIDDFVGDGKGFFDFGEFADLRYLEPGILNTGKIKFKILSNKSIRYKNCLIVGFEAYGKKHPTNKISIRINNEKIRGIAFLHTCLLNEPDYNHKKIGQYIIVFNDGKTDTIDLIQNFNITDIRSSQSVRENVWNFSRAPDILIGSERAWTGKSATNAPLNLQNIVWENPYPEKPIKKIIFKAIDIDQRLRIALIGLTLIRDHI